MLKKAAFALIIICSFPVFNAIESNIIIRDAIKDELPELLELDRNVSYEYFMPIYNSKEYAHLPLGRNPTHYLDLEIDSDSYWFSDCIEGKAPENLWVAYDKDNNKVAGLIIAHQSSSGCMEIDLFP